MEGTDYFHLSGVMLEPGSTIVPGNFGRVVRLLGWRHSLATRETVLENCRVSKFPHLPSRLDAAYVFVTADEALRFKAAFSNQQQMGFDAHLLYRVRLLKPEAPSHVADWRLVSPTGAFGFWPEVYWQGTLGGPVPGVQQPGAVGVVDHREMLTLSHLVIQERLNAV